MRTLTCSMENSSWWWVLGRIWTWNCDWVLWWNHSLFLPQNFCLHSWLSRKVCYYCILMLHKTNCINPRILMSTVWNMGACPCPRCLISKDHIHLVGTKRDMQQRTTLARVDNLQHQTKITTAHDMIYECNWAVDSAPVQLLLKPKSLVPTEVSI